MYKLTEKELKNIFINHPPISIESCKHCGGYQTVTKEFDKFDMTIATTCKQCSHIETYSLVD